MIAVTGSDIGTADDLANPTSRARRFAYGANASKHSWSIYEHESMDPLVRRRGTARRVLGPQQPVGSAQRHRQRHRDRERFHDRRGERHDQPIHGQQHDAIRRAADQHHAVRYAGELTAVVESAVGWTVSGIGCGEIKKPRPLAPPGLLIERLAPGSGLGSLVDALDRGVE